MPGAPSRGDGRSGASSARSTPPWLHGLQRRSRQPARTAPLKSPWIAERVDRVLRAASGGTCRSRPASAARTCSATRRRGRCRGTSRRVAFPSTSVDLLDEPLVAARVGRLGDARARRRGRSRGRRRVRSASSCHVSRSCRLTRFRTTAFTDRLRHGEAEPGLTVGIVVARKPVQRQVARRDRASLPVDRIEVPRPGQAMPALHSRTARSGGEPLATLGAAALEDHLSGARRHARAEAVLALAAADVGLVRAFHVELSRSCVREGRRTARDAAASV